MKIAKLCITSRGKLIERKHTVIKVKVGEKEVGEVIAYGTLQIKEFVVPVFDHNGVKHE